MKNVVSRERKMAAATYKKMRTLRYIINSHAHSETSIILDAIKYIDELKHRVERINQETAMAQNSTCQKSCPVQQRVEAQDKGFLIKVFSEICCGGLLVFLLEAFEELGLDVFQDRVSCSEGFLFEAVGVKDDQGSSECLNVQDVKRGVWKAIQNWSNQVKERT